MRIALAVLNYQVFRTFPDLFKCGQIWKKQQYGESSKTRVKELDFLTEVQCQSLQGRWLWILLLHRFRGRWLSQGIPAPCWKKGSSVREVKGMSLERWACYCCWDLGWITSTSSYGSYWLFLCCQQLDPDFCMDLVHYCHFAVLDLCLKPALKFWSVEESAKVSSYP